MSEGKKEAVVAGLPVSQFRALLTQGTDEGLVGFLQSFALGAAADQFISQMNGPDERAGFIAAIAERYPDDWKKAIDEWAKAKTGAR